MNIGQLITYMLLNSQKTNQEIVDIVHSKFVCKTSLACVAWYATKLRKEGKLQGSRKQKQSVELSAEDLAELVK